MCFKFAVLALTCLGGLTAQPMAIKEKRHVDGSQTNDLEPAASHHEDPHEAIQASSKYFQDIYMAMEKPNELQFGHVAENPNNWEQRFEKINLDSLQRQGKVRWGDKDGGYGEHYWDYNHGGHDGDHHHHEEEETKHEPQYAAPQVQPQQAEHRVQESRQAPAYAASGVKPQQARYRQESRQSPVYAAPQAKYRQESKVVPAYAVANNQRGKREGLLGDVEFINDNARSLILDGNAQKHGGNYRRADDYRGKREQHVINEEDLVFESDKGTFLDRKTGIEYELRPIY
ncbi:hypothetical protein NQ315_000356 [Exocentrus adspersus]|uniref:Uncharacterized protein n=1 Tax=Exocentrus adspersus TaxID=1586481 RepID=A0AAV8VLU3_9CUCU|nr:hypothetical protein NQ315_000356 [Exocentrus adspersus]